MTSANKITFGNNAANSYKINNNNFGYASGENTQNSYSAPRGGSTGINGAVTATNYQAYEPARQAVYGGHSYNGVNHSHVQMGSPAGVKYQAVKDVYHPAPVTKITFGGKQFTQTFDSQVNSKYVATNYVAPVQTYQTYETYRQPAQIATFNSQPIREEVRHEQRVEAPSVQTGEVKVAANTPTVTNTVVETRTKPKKNGGCPAWLWPLLGILALLALIIGLLFGLGVFGRGGSSATGAAVSTGGAKGGATGGATGGAAATSGVAAKGAYTDVEQTIILSKDKNTSTSSGGAVTPEDVAVPMDIVFDEPVKPTATATNGTSGSNGSNVNGYTTYPTPSTGSSNSPLISSAASSGTPVSQPSTVSPVNSGNGSTKNLQSGSIVNNRAHVSATTSPHVNYVLSSSAN